MGQNDGGSVVRERSLDHFAGVDRSLGQGAGKQFIGFQQMILGIEPECHEDFMRFAGQFQAQPVAHDAGRGKCVAGCHFLGQGPTGEFEAGLELGRLGHAVTVHDAHADSAEALHEYGIPLVADALDRKYDMVVLAVPHREYLTLGGEALRGLLNDGGTLADLKGELGSAADWTL